MHYLIPIGPHPRKLLSLVTFQPGIDYDDWFPTLTNGIQSLKSQGAQYLLIDLVSTKSASEAVPSDSRFPDKQCGRLCLCCLLFA